MKHILAIVVFGLIFFGVAQAQESRPQILQEPKAWEFERFALPPSFAPAITYKGAEELRFAPGMFKKGAADYFTYVFVAQLEDLTSISETEIKNYLLNYYKGLCGVTAKDRKLAIDTTQIAVTLKKKKDALLNTTTYDATVNLFGVFADGAPVKLNMEISSLSDIASKRTYLFFIASPLEKKDPIWKQLYEVRKESLKGIHD